MNDDLTSRLRDQLHQQVDDWHSTPLTFESVRGRAHGIRRARRMAVAAAGAVAVVAVVLPVSLLGDPAGRGDSPPEITNTPTRAAEPGEPVLGIPYVTGDRVVLPDGTTRALPEDYEGGVVLGDTVLGLRQDGSGVLVLDELGADGTVVDSEVVESGVARNAAGTAVTYVSDGDLVVRWEGGRTSLGDVGAVTPVRLVGGPDCSGEAADCSVYANDELGGSRVFDTSGSVEDVTAAPITLTDVAPDLRLTVVSPGTDPGDPGSCSTLVRPRGGMVHSSCEYTYGDFSPGGTLISATHPYQDGFGDGWHAILDAETGEELARYESPSGGVTGSVWEDEDHLLVTSWEDGDWLVTRVGTDGTTETVLGPTRGADVEPPYGLMGEAF